MDLGLLIIRFAIGLTVATHGAQKLFGWFGGYGIEGTGKFLDSLRFRPGRQYAVLGGLAEFAGGLLIAAGLLVPLGSAAVIAMMVSAIVSVHLSNGFFNSNGGYEYPMMIALVAAGVAFAGPGEASLDYALGWDIDGAWGIVAVLLGLAGGGLGLLGRHLASLSPIPGSPHPQL